MVDRRATSMAARKPLKDVDPASPLSTRQEAFTLACFGGKSQSDAYREAYPASLKWGDASVRVNASELAALPQVQARLEWLRKQAASAKVLTVTQAKEILTRMARGEESEFTETVTQGGIARLERSSKQGALALLARLEGWEKAQKVEHSGVIENRWTVADIREG